MKKLFSLFLSLALIVAMLPTSLAAGFDDVSESDWYYNAVNYVVSNGIMSGYSDATFGPNDTLTRAMVVQVLYNKEGQPALNGAAHSFSDVSADQWFNNAVTWGSSRGVVSGFGGGRFKPQDTVTIEQVAVILHNYASSPTGNGDLTKLGSYSDWASSALRWAVEKGILENVPFTSATDSATRAQTAQILTNYLSDKPDTPSANKATGISLDITSHKMGEDWTQYLTATLSPAGTTDTITWSSSNPKVATVDQKGKVSGVAGGEAIITAKIPSGATATCKIEVWHNHKLTSSKAVTCTEGGVDVYTCTVCGHSYESWTPALGKSHSWKPATCSEPKTCTVCGTTSGNPISHKWKAATCTTPKTCTACEKTEGNSLGHVANSTGKCTRCGQIATIDMKTKVSAPTEEFAMLRKQNSVGLIKLNWTADNNSGKTIKYYTVTGYYYNAVGDPARNDITGKTSYTVKYVGPVAPGEMLLVSDFGYCSICHSVVIGEITLEYMDGTSDTGWYGYRITGF